MNTIKKTLQRSEECFVQFTEEEMSSLNIKPGDKFTCKLEDGGLTLQKYKELDIDLSEWPRETLEMLITLSVEKDISVNDVIVDCLEQYIASIDQ